MCLVTYARSKSFLSFSTPVVMDGTLGPFFKPEKNLDFFRLKNGPRDAHPGKLE